MSTTPVVPSVASLLLTVSFDPAINYAFQQNAIPVVKELRFQNDDVARKDLVIRVATEPAFAVSAEMRLKNIAAEKSRQTSGVSTWFEFQYAGKTKP